MRTSHPASRAAAAALTLALAAGCAPRQVAGPPVPPIPPRSERPPPTTLAVLLDRRVELDLTEGQLAQLDEARRLLDERLRPLEATLQDLIASRGHRPAGGSAESRGERGEPEGGARPVRPEGSGPAPGGGRGGHGGRGGGGRLVDPLAFGHRVEALLDQLADEDLAAYLRVEEALTPAQLPRARELVTEQRGLVQDRREAVRRRLDLTGD